MKEGEDGSECEDYVRGGRICGKGMSSWQFTRQQELRSSGEFRDIKECEARAECPLGWDWNCLAYPTESTNSEAESLGLA